MLMNTHMLIGQKVYENVQNIMNINLNKNKFIYGNVKPDIAYRLSSISHCMKDSLCFVLNEISNLLLPTVDDLGQFAINLGVINHFLSDFFCYPHFNTEKYNTMVKHINYEHNLHKVFKKLDKHKLLDLSTLQLNQFNKKTILDTILFLENSYKKQHENIEKDIYYALRISTLASIHILEGSSALDKKLVA